jgi:hypothetical protein
MMVLEWREREHEETDATDPQCDRQPESKDCRACTHMDIRVILIAPGVEATHVLCSGVFETHCL